MSHGSACSKQFNAIVAWYKKLYHDILLQMFECRWLFRCNKINKSFDWKDNINLFIFLNIHYNPISMYLFTIIASFNSFCSMYWRWSSFSQICDRQNSIVFISCINFLIHVLIYNNCIWNFSKKARTKNLFMRKVSQCSKLKFCNLRSRL